MPSFSNKTTQAFDLLSKVDSSSVIVTWWDYELVKLFSGLASVHDGGSQRSPKTYLVANANIDFTKIPMI